MSVISGASANVIYLATIWVIPAFIAITFHKALARCVSSQRRRCLTIRTDQFQPIKHIDPVGTILLDGSSVAVFCFCYAKPVPVNFRELRSPPRDMVRIAAAGPAIDITFAAISVLAFHVVGYLSTSGGRWLAANLRNRAAPQRGASRIQFISESTSRRRA